MVGITLPLQCVVGSYNITRKLNCLLLGKIVKSHHDISLLFIPCWKKIGCFMCGIVYTVLTIPSVQRAEQIRVSEPPRTSRLREQFRQKLLEILIAVRSKVLVAKWL